MLLANVRLAILLHVSDRGLEAIVTLTNRGPLSTSVRLLGACLMIGSLVLACRLVWEMTVLTWREGLQAVGFSVAHLAPTLYLLGIFSAVGSAIWCLVVLVCAALHLRTLARLDWFLLVLSGVVIGSVTVPYSAWRWMTVRFLGPPPLSSQSASLLVSAAAEGDLDCVRELLARGLDVDIPNSAGQTALFAASASGQLGAVAILLRHGARVDRQVADGQTALHAACRNGHMDIVKSLLLAGADPTLRTRPSGLTPSDLAWGAGHVEIVHLLDGQAPSGGRSNKDEP